MEKRKYGHIKEKEEEILLLKEAGNTKREIAEAMGLETEQIKEFLKRHRRRERRIVSGMVTMPKGRPRKDGELERLRMENKLLRDFLLLTERM